MQDLSTGEMRDLTPFLKDLPKDASAFEQRQALDKACAAAQPDAAKRGPVFEVGEVLEIKGGRFQVARITKQRLELVGVPTRS